MVEEEEEEEEEEEREDEGVLVAGEKGRVGGLRDGRWQLKLECTSRTRESPRVRKKESGKDGS